MTPRWQKKALQVFESTCTCCQEHLNGFWIFFQDSLLVGVYLPTTAWKGLDNYLQFLVSPSLFPLESYLWTIDRLFFFLGLAKIYGVKILGGANYTWIVHDFKVGGVRCVPSSKPLFFSFLGALSKRAAYLRNVFDGKTVQVWLEGIRLALNVCESSFQPQNLFFFPFYSHI